MENRTAELARLVVSKLAYSNLAIVPISSLLNQNSLILEGSEQLAFLLILNE